MRTVSWTESPEAAKKEKSGPPQQMKSCNLPSFFINHENQNRNNTNKTVISSVFHIHTKNSAPIFFLVCGNCDS